MDDGAADGWLLKRESARVSRGCQGSAIAPNKLEHAPPRASGPLSAQLEPTHHGGDYQIGVVIRTDKNYRLPIPGVVVCEYALHVKH